MADLESGLIVEDDAEQIPLAVNGDDSSLGGSNKGKLPYYGASMHADMIQENEATNNLNHDGGANGLSNCLLSTNPTLNTILQQDDADMDADGDPDADVPPA